MEPACRGENQGKEVKENHECAQKDKSEKNKFINRLCTNVRKKSGVLRTKP